MGPILSTRARRWIEKNCDELAGLLLHKYPEFILSRRSNELADIPAFVFHDVNLESLEPLLAFLAENQYRALTADEYVERQAQRDREQQREVLLTFDDGHKSLYSVAYPALRQYGLKAVAYIVPGVIPEGVGLSRREIWDKTLCTWNEIREMHESGILDFQSHSMYHHSIPISARIRDFVRDSIDFPFLEPHQALVTQANGTTPSGGFAYGTPIYKGAPRFSRMRAYMDGPSVNSACIDEVNRHGGTKYFNKAGWRRRLHCRLIEARRLNAASRFETDVEQRRAMLTDMLDSKREIERHLPKKIVTHFCFPWFRGSPLAIQLSAEAGYVSNAWGSLVPRFARTASAPMPIPRLAPYYIWRLPGKGRQPLGDVLLERLRPIQHEQPKDNV
jgi:peptidoglycan/xylan/chitin deacetylase (PgdA/CDA1 family)